MVSKLPDEIICLRNINSLIGGAFNLDDISGIKGYWKNAKLNSSTVFEWLSSARRMAITTQEFDVQIKKIKMDLIEHLDKRIYLLEQLRKVKSEDESSQPIQEHDPWISTSFSQPASEREPLVRASLHIREVLFACNEIVSCIPNVAEKFDKNELKKFVNKTLPIYLKQLPASSQSDPFTKALQNAFNSLERRIKREDMKSAKRTLSKIEELLKTSLMS